MRGDKGWAKVPPARRFHFFDVEGTLCRTVRTLGIPAEAFVEPTGQEVPDKDDCAKCWEKLNHRPVEPVGGA